ncbi:LPD7 domain-containing protein [Rahnella perminowiae]|uniref:LPD7 domain-containing protein n=1 Tax=Rahnella perminowiae TaxID=2816244 RepID=UPI00215BB141|nr:LPD7 domain-containing protein [Rahnella perminowiae]MCR8998669.1 hypothetical protein [Rahnella perminowiae]MCR8998727.1 hypothetical protein [Rahnella perminowiae]
MGSKDIRQNIRKESTWRNTISRPEENEQEGKGAKQRFAKISQDMEENLGERSIREKVRIITAADLYTRKAKISSNIHYLDKSNDKTLFVDTGNSIAVSKNGLSESSVAVALELAKEKFGSTLTVKGTEAFKNTAIEVVAQKGLDIHFTDKEMNRRLTERKQELSIEREGQSLSAQPVSTVDAEVERILSNPNMRRLYMNDDQKQREWNAAPGQYEDVRAEISAEIEARIRERATGQPVAAQSDASTTVSTSVIDAEVERVLSNPNMRRLYMNDDQKQREWNAAPGQYEDVRAEISAEIEARIRERATGQPVAAQSDASTTVSTSVIDAEVERVLSNPNMRRLYMNDDQKQREWNAAPGQYEDVRAEISAEIEARIREGATSQPVAVQPGAATANKPTNIRHEGVLLEHGNAPYNFNPDMTKPENERDDSYYVKLQRPGGSEKVIWGVSLEKAVQGLNVGERVSLTNLGKEKVEWDQKLANGQTEHRSGERVAWEGKPLDREVDNEVPPQHENKQGNQAAEAEYDGPSVD